MHFTPSLTIPHCQIVMSLARGIFVDLTSWSALWTLVLTHH